MKILVTGASGFIGQHLVEALLVAGHEVIATSSNRKKASVLSWFGKVNYVEYNISTEVEKRNLFHFFQEPDLMIHLAWSGLPNFQSLQHFEDTLFAQCKFLNNILSHGLKSITITGTCQEYGMAVGCLSETISVEPVTAYAVAKDSLRKYVNLLVDLYHFSFKWVRLFYMFGSGQHYNSLIPQLEKALEEGVQSFKMSGGKQMRDYMPISNVAEALVKIASQDKIVGVINCCSGLPITVEKLIENYLRGAGKKMKLELGYYPYADYEPMEFWGDTKLLNQILDNDRSN